MMHFSKQLELFVMSLANAFYFLYFYLRRIFANIGTFYSKQVQSSNIQISSNKFKAPTLKSPPPNSSSNIHLLQQIQSSNIQISSNKFKAPTFKSPPTKSSSNIQISIDKFKTPSKKFKAPPDNIKLHPSKSSLHPTKLNHDTEVGATNSKRHATSLIVKNPRKFQRNSCNQTKTALRTSSSSNKWKSG